MRIVACLAIASLVGCASTTVIRTEPSGAKLRIDGASRGETPVRWTETVNLWTQHFITLRKPGYKEQSGRIAADQWNTGKMVISILCFLPGLAFSTEFPPVYEFALEREVQGGIEGHVEAPVQTYDPDGLLAAKP